MKPRILLAILIDIYFGWKYRRVFDLCIPNAYLREVPAPVVFNHSEDYWRGLYAFGFAVSNTSIQETVEQFLVVMDYDGNYVNFENSSSHNFNYVNQLSENELYYYLRPQRREGEAGSYDSS